MADPTQTLFRWLDKQPMAQSHAELQSQVDGFDHIYNTERPHQGLPGRITPQRSWDATAIAEEPRPSPILPEANSPESRTLGVAQRLMAAVEQGAAVFATRTVKEDTLATLGLERVTGSIIHPSGTGSRKLKVYSNGVVNIGRTIIASWDDDGVIFANTDGEVVADYAWPPKGTAYVGISKSRPLFGKDQNPGQLSPKS